MEGPQRRVPGAAQGHRNARGTFETWTAGYLGMHDKPVVLLDPHGHYAGLRR